MEPNIVFINDPIYTKPERNLELITDQIHDFHIESSSDEGEGEYKYSVLSIDIGILHLGISVSRLDEEYKLVDITWVDLIDITKMSHKTVSKENCPFYHTKTFCDWMAHVFQDHREFFDQADYILIERQPPQGLVGVEQIIFAAYRDKTILVHPSSMHKHFGIGDYDYDQRKVEVEKIAKKHLTDKNLLKQLKYYDRSHDVCDSICLMLFWIHNKHNEYIHQKRYEESMATKKYVWNGRKQVSMTTEEWFDMHKYKGK